MSDLRITAPVSEDADKLFRGHSLWLIQFLRRRFGANAEDLAQEAFVRSVASGATIQNPRAFLARLALRAAADQERSDGPARRLLEAREADSEYLPDQLERVLLQQLLRELPPKVREVYLLCRVAGLTYAEAAERCGISVKRVEARMTEAHRRFAALMRD